MLFLYNNINKNNIDNNTKIDNGTQNETMKTPLPSIPREAKGTHVRDQNPLHGQYRIYHQSITSQKNYKLIQEQKTFDSKGFVGKMRDTMPSLHRNGY